MSSSTSSSSSSSSSSSPCLHHMIIWWWYWSQGDKNLIMITIIIIFSFSCHHHHGIIIMASSSCHHHHHHLHHCWTANEFPLNQFLLKLVPDMQIIQWDCHQTYYCCLQFLYDSLGHFVFFFQSFKFFDGCSDFSIAFCDLEVTYQLIVFNASWMW